MRRFFSKVTLFLPLFLVIVTVSGLGDPGDLVHLPGEVALVQEMADAMLDGWNIRSALPVDIRLLKQQYVARSPHNLDIILYGSSRVLSARADTFTGALFFNSAVFSGPVEDILIMYEMHHQIGMRPSIAILDVSWPLLDQSYNDYYTYWQAFGVQYLAASERLGLPVTLQTRYDLATALLDRFIEMISPAYFQASFDALRQAGFRPPVPEFTHATIAEYGHSILLADGSLYQRPPKQPIELRWRVYNPYVIDPATVKMLERIIDSMKDDGTEVVLLLSPLYQAFYQQSIEETDILAQLDTYYQDLANRKGIALLGSYDPDIYGCAETEFTDQDHPSNTCFVKILCAASRSEHPSPLLPYCRATSDR